MSELMPFHENLYAAGQPTPDNLESLARVGVRTVINLRAPGEPVDFDEAAETRRLGLHYVEIPVVDATDLEPARIARFGAALDEARPKGGVLIHCASSNRAGAMVALDCVLGRGTTLEAGLARGRAAGLASLEPAVVALANQVRK